MISAFGRELLRLGWMSSSNRGSVLIVSISDAARLRRESLPAQDRHRLPIGQGARVGESRVNFPVNFAVRRLRDSVYDDFIAR